MNKKLTTQILLALGLILMLGAAGYAMGATADISQTIGQGNPSFDELSVRFKALADNKGAVYAFQVLKVAELPPGTDLHLLGHVVGDELYKQKGPAGIADCTQDFRNACSHAIAIGTLDDYGAGSTALSLIHDACEKAPGGSGAYAMCYHGLGHGVFAYFGYDLSKTVAFCQKTGTAAQNDIEYQECVGGAIMELSDGGGHDHDQWLLARQKYFTAADPLAPCSTSIIPQEAKSMCYTYLTPHLWEAAGMDLGNPDPSLFGKAFSYCNAISDNDLRATCWDAFGKEFVPLAGARDIRNVAGYSDQEYQLAISWCDLAPNPQAKGLCVGEGAASVFWGGENDPSGVLRYCKIADTMGDGAGCWQRFASDIKQYTPTRTDLCQDVPTQYQSLCESHASKT